MSPIDLVLSRVGDAKRSSDDRWRARCPACEGNTAKLSVGIGHNDSVLLKCFGGCAIDEVVVALGLEMADLFPSRNVFGRLPRRHRMLSDRQANELIRDEVRLISIALLGTEPLSDAERSRVATAWGRIEYLCDEARA